MYSAKLLIGILLAALNFTAVDRSFERESYVACRDSLTVMLGRAESGKERAEVLWRLSRVSLMLGEKAGTKEAKRALFSEGVRYADEARSADPSNTASYMWHCANLGRECQTRTVKDQIAAVPVLERDLETILDRYGRTDCSEAWQALSELYHSHPFKSNDKAVGFARKAVDTIPRDELRVTTYLNLAHLLYERNSPASKRASSLASDAGRFKASGQKNTERFGYYAGAGDPAGKAPWSARPLAELSDREEALLLVEYTIRKYEGASHRTKMDARDYKTLQSLQQKWKTN